jgi:hypothetical protein
MKRENIAAWFSPQVKSKARPRARLKLLKNNKNHQVLPKAPAAVVLVLTAVVVSAAVPQALPELHGPMFPTVPPLVEPPKIDCPLIDAPVAHTFIASSLTTTIEFTEQVGANVVRTNNVPSCVPGTLTGVEAVQTASSDVAAMVTELQAASANAIIIFFMSFS